jgi:hypothetical protein
MEGNPVIEKLTVLLEADENVEGAFVYGSLVNDHRDAYSDIEFGVLVKNTAAALNTAYDAHPTLLSAVGKPTSILESSRDHVRVVSALYGKDAFPPVGVEVKLTFGQLRYAQEMLPYADYAILTDKSGKVAAALEKLRRTRPPEATERMLNQQVQSYAFAVQDALKAYQREADFDLQAVLEDLRERIFFAAAARFGGQIEGAKRAQRYLSVDEHQLFAESYQAPTLDTIRRMNELYAGYLDELQTNFKIGDGGEPLRTTLQTLL